MKIGVIMGGISSEKDISLISGKEVLNNIDLNKYDVVPVVIDRSDELVDKVKGLDMAFLALHGAFGEDGTVQGVLETLGIPYTGCNLISSSICMDKDISKKILRYAGINTADWMMATGKDDIDIEKIEEMGYPVVVKPNSGGSSVATCLAGNRDELYKDVSEALKYDREVMIEKYITGDEITCCILNGKMLPVLAIKPKAEFFDYTSKYTDGGADEHVVKLEEPLNKKVEEMALKTYKELKCSIYARVDMILSDKVPYVLEVNTLPGMTQNSLFPKSAAAAGMSYAELLDAIISLSLKYRHK